MALGRRQQALLQIAAQPKIAEPYPLAAPLKGWNTRDPFEAMDAQDAVILDNLQPDYGGIIPREGGQIHDQHATSSDPVTTLIVWRKGSQSQLLAAAGQRIWVVGASADLGTGYHSAWWNGAMFNGRLILANGVDPLQIYDGTTLGPLTIGVDPNPVAGSPIYPSFDPATMIAVQVVHNLIFLWDGHSPGFWYGNAPYAFQGNILHWFPLDMVTATGANVVAINTLTYDGGQGIRAYTTIFMSDAEMLVYTGTSPDIALGEDPVNGWSLQGIYTVAPPALGGSNLPRAMCRYGGDIYTITSSDYVKLSQLIVALKDGTFPPRSKASGACMAATAQGRGLDGWQMIYWGGGRRLIVNVPLIAPDPGANNANFEQHVYNTGLNAWCRFRGLNAYCWCVLDDQVFYGTTDGTVCQFGLATADQQPNGAEVPIDCFGLQAWNLFGTAHNKRVAAIRPVVRSAAAVYYEFGVGFDYAKPDTPIAVQHFGSRTPWGSPWGSPWERPAETDSLWYVAGGDGSALSVAMHVITNNEEIWIWSRTDWRIDPGIAL